MPMRMRFWLLAGSAMTCGWIVSAWARENAVEDAAADSKKVQTEAVSESPSNLMEARNRARLLHDALHGTLQTVHRDYYRENEGLKIPAATLKGVFEDLSKSRGVELRWLAIDARAMNVDHEPQSDFDKEAVKAIHGGKEFHEAVDGGRYRYAGAIVLHAECLKCHLPARSSNKARSAALVITMPIAAPSR